MIDEILVQAAQRHGLDVEAGVQVLGVESVMRRAFDPSWALLILPRSGQRSPAAGPATATTGAAGTFEPSVLPGRAGHGSTPLDVLRALYPSNHPVLGLDGAPDTTLAALDPAELSRAPHLLPALGPLANLASPHGLPWIAARLRAPDGCPWDREQDHRSLRPFLLEEAYEAYDALEQGGTAELAGELGDLLLQIVLHAQIAAEAGLFDLDDIYREIGAKIVRRHPHVFADAEAATANDVLQNWERIKAGERAARGGDPRASASLPAAFAGLARSLPALAYSQEMQGRAAALGYDWPDVEGVIDKLGEEAVELLEARTDAERAEEFGDLLLVLVNLARKLGVDAESALRDGNAKFARRFASVERFAEERGRTLDTMSFEELDELWDQAKAEERATARGEGDA
ncbi:MAG: nucleoside triphosphate pyrophosphohydrolase [Candidatus Limnocylindrales bacterium]